MTQKRKYRIREGSPVWWAGIIAAAGSAAAMMWLVITLFLTVVGGLG